MADIITGFYRKSDIEKSFTTNEDEYKEPVWPFELPSFQEYKENPESFQFGRPAKKKHFFLTDEFAYLNQGAVGCALKQAIHASHQWEDYVETQPLRFYDRESYPYLMHVVRRVAKMADCDPRCLVLLDNATTAANCVIRSIKFKPTDKIYILNIIYPAVRKLVNHVAAESGCQVQEECLSFPLQSKEQILDVVRKTLNSDVRLAIFDHISSGTALVLPVKELVQICHEKGVPVLIDAAHAISNIPFSIRDINPDYYLSNCHKWLNSPKTSALLYVKEELQETLIPPIISHGYRMGYHAGFLWPGTRNYAPILGILTALDFLDAVGVERIMKRNHDLVVEAAQFLAREWNTDLLAGSDLSGCMVCVRLPSPLYENADDISERCAEVATLIFELKVEVPIKEINKQLYARISAHIHNEMADYAALASAVHQLVARCQTGSA